MHRNILTVAGITILFLGISIQSAIAVNPNSTNNEEDCSICLKVSKTHLVRLKRLLNRLETLNNKLSLISKYNPEVVEKYQELSDRITALKEMNNELNLDAPIKNKIICAILWRILVPCMIIIEIFTIIQNYTTIGSFILLVIIFPLTIISLPIFFSIAGLGATYYDCWELPSWPWWEYA
jgi:hypothetical protein